MEGFAHGWLAGWVDGCGRTEQKRAQGKLRLNNEEVSSGEALGSELASASQPAGKKLASRENDEEGVDNPPKTKEQADRSAGCSIIQCSKTVCVVCM